MPLIFEPSTFIIYDEEIDKYVQSQFTGVYGKKNPFLFFDPVNMGIKLDAKQLEPVSLPIGGRGTIELKLTEAQVMGGTPECDLLRPLFLKELDIKSDFVVVPNYSIKPIGDEGGGWGNPAKKIFRIPYQCFNLRKDKDKD